ncbi:MAG: DHCW motif cupin fold protein [Dokdonella sp.]
MQFSDIPFGTTDWSCVERTEHAGESGIAYWRTRQFPSVRVRMVEYMPGYRSDHWCSKGHILLCIDGELLTELEDGRIFTLTPGMSYQVSDHAEPHRSSTKIGARLFIID